MAYKKVLVTFSDSRLFRSTNRLVSEAQSLGFYDEIISLDEYSLDSDFSQYFKSELQPEIRGFGYWVWKPQVILQALASLDYGDVLQYADVGFTINPKGIERLNDYFERAAISKTGIVAFQGRRPEYPMVDDGRELPTWPDREWTKGDLFDYFGVRNKPEITDTPTVQAGLLFVRKTPKAEEILTKWLDVYYADFHLADDSPSISPNFPEFREHRHDQSIFSILAKIYAIDTYSSNEFWFPQTMSSRGDWKALAFAPFHATRSLDFGFWGNLRHKAKYLYKAFQPQNLSVSFRIFFSRLKKRRVITSKQNRS